MFTEEQLKAMVDKRVEEAVAKRLTEALELRSVAERMNPFAASHHSDSISINSPPGSLRLPADGWHKREFKKEVAAHYGLTSPNEGMVFNMLGEEKSKSEVILAHIWPRSYTNWDDPCQHLGMPKEFYRDPRCFLLLPEEVEKAFDKGVLIFIPSPPEGAAGRRAIAIHVIQPRHALATDYVKSLDGKQLNIPQGLPYCRILAFFALMAKRVAAAKKINCEPHVEAALHLAESNATDSTSGQEALTSFVGKLRTVRVL